MIAILSPTAYSDISINDILAKVFVFPRIIFNKEFLIKRSHSCSSIGDCSSKDISTLNSTSCIEIVSKLLINALTENEKFIPRRKIYSHSSVHCAKGKTSKDLLLLLIIKLLFYNWPTAASLYLFLSLQ